jgi:RimJ/RimL family protein N-acetyltransferase
MAKRKTRRESISVMRLETERTIMRPMCADDFPAILAWPPYPWPCEQLGMTQSDKPEADGRLWWQRFDASDRLHYTVRLGDTREIIGVYAFVGIKWDEGLVRNMGIRFRPDCCGRGYGQETFRPLIETLFAQGIRLIRLDVAAVNERAWQCYRKCGFRITGEFWDEHHGREVDPADPKWAFALPHLKREDGKWRTRFYWMEIEAPESAS